MNPILLIVLCFVLSDFCYSQTAVDFYERGGAKYDLQDYRGAVADYTKAIELKPDFAEAYNDRGVAKDDLMDYQGAVADYTTAIKLKPEYAEVPPVLRTMD